MIRASNIYKLESQSYYCLLDTPSMLLIFQCKPETRKIEQNETHFAVNVGNCSLGHGVVLLFLEFVLTRTLRVSTIFSLL